MGTRSAANPYGSSTGLVDKLIGDAYPVVKKVYDNMPFIMAVGAALMESPVGTPMLTARRFVETGSTAALGATVTIPFTDLDVSHLKILSSDVKVIGTDGALYFSDSGNFTSKVTNLGLVLSLKSSAPPACANALVEWFVIYGE